MDYLVHHGIKGQKWGVRRYQNPDGTLTEEGRKRYDVIEKGSSVRRVSGVKSKGTTNPVGLYTYGEESADAYERYAKYLPSVNPSYSSKVKKAKITQYEFTRDAKLLSGHEAVNSYMKEFGNQTMKEFERNAPLREAAHYDLVNDLCSKYADKRVREVYETLAKKPYIGHYSNSDAMKFAHTYLHFSTLQVSEELSKDKVTNIKKFCDQYRDLGYDVIVDPEDFSAGFEDPYLIINQDSVKEVGSYKYRLK